MRNLWIVLAMACHGGHGHDIGFGSGDVGGFPDESGSCGFSADIRPSGSLFGRGAYVEAEVRSVDEPWESLSAEIRVFDDASVVPGGQTVRSFDRGWHVSWTPSEPLAAGRTYQVEASYSYVLESGQDCFATTFGAFGVLAAPEPLATPDGAWVVLDHAGVSADAALLLRLLGLEQRYRVLSVQLSSSGVTMGTRRREVGFPLWPEDGDEWVPVGFTEHGWQTETAELTWDDSVVPLVLRDARISGETPTADGMVALRLMGTLSLGALEASLQEEACTLAGEWGRDCAACDDGPCIPLDARLLRASVP